MEPIKGPPVPNAARRLEESVTLLSQRTPGQWIWRILLDSKGLNAVLGGGAFSDASDFKCGVSLTCVFVSTT